MLSGINFNHCFLIRLLLPTFGLLLDIYAGTTQWHLFASNYKYLRH